MKKASSETLVVIGVVGVILLIFGGILWFDKSKNEETAGGLEVGDDAPDFSIQDYSDRKVSSSDYSGKNVLLYFNEGVGCAPCWQQIVQLQKDEEKFKALNTEIVTIGVDSASLWKPIVDANKIELPVLIDTTKKMSRDYKILDFSSSMHVGDKPGHTFVLVGADKKIKWVGDYPDMRVTDKQILDKIKIALK